MAEEHEMDVSLSDRQGQPAEVATGTRVAITRVNVNLPSLLVQAIDAIATRLGLNRTDVIVRALNREAYFARLQAEDPNARFFVERSTGEHQEVVFVVY
ncbi:MAG: hypothetical protein JOZ46_03560 [Candidatus Dormibacteraeota bacterium]|nr:hypothetical protein [Candidatus Dormibacteraeota bacterium]